MAKGGRKHISQNDINYVHGNLFSIIPADFPQFSMWPELQ
jgi:hypothetical protein